MSTPPLETLNLSLALPPAPLFTPTPTVELNDRDLAIISKVGEYKYLSSTQLKRLFWAHAEHQTAAKRLTQLVRAGFLRRRFIDSKATDEAHNSRLAVYDWPGPCQTRLKQHCLERRAEGRWQAYAAVIKSHAHEKTVSSGFLRHEIALSEFFLCLEQAVAREGWTLWWARTSSPRTKGVSCWVKLDPDDPDSEAVHFSPDALWGLADRQQQYRFGTLEFENRDKKKGKQAYRRRLRGHQAVAEQNIFAGVLSQFIEDYHVPLRTDPRSVGMHSLTLASDAGLRDDLFLACASLHSSAVRFSFASLTDVMPETALTPIWLRAAAGMASSPAQEPLLPGGPPVVRPALERHDLEALTRVSLGE
jgi:protein involved in plasmid replication-relaxation